MIQDAEQYADEDKKIREKTDARNSLESYLYNIKNSLTDDGYSGGGGGVADKMGEADREVRNGKGGGNNWAVCALGTRRVESSRTRFSVDR